MHTKQTVVLINGKKNAQVKIFVLKSSKLKAQKSLEARGKTVQILSIAAQLKRLKEIVKNTTKELDYFKNTPKHDKIEVLKLGVKLVDSGFRQIIQRLGTDVLSELFGDNIWIDPLKRQIDGQLRFSF